MSWQAWRLSQADAVRLGRVRHRAELEVCEAGGSVWIRAADPAEDLLRELAGLTALQFSALPDGQLVEKGRSVPCGYLPKDPWLPLTEWMRVELDVPALGATPAKVSVQLVRSANVEAANVLFTLFADWHSYAVSAPQVRLDRLAFAVNDAGWAVIRGVPLPSIKGTRFVERDGVAVQAGWTWQPPVSSDILAAAMGVANRDLALMHADGSWDHLREDDFVRASRAAVRQSAEELPCGR